METKNQPIHSVRFGRVKASIWKNEGEHGTFYSVTIAKTYRDENGDFQDTDSLNSGDLLNAAEALRVARHHIQELDSA